MLAPLEGQSPAVLLEKPKSGRDATGGFSTLLSRLMGGVGCHG